MKELTKSEEQIMQILWKIEKGFVKEIIEYFNDPKPAYNTVSTIIRILEDKEFVGHNAYGRSHQYFPTITKDEYRKTYFKKFVKNYFSGSFQKTVSFFSEAEDISIDEIEQLRSEMDSIIRRKKSKNN